MILKHAASFALCILWLFACGAKTVTGKVVAVKDGDTIVVLSARQQYTIRLDGVDCPELKQPYGRKARQFTSGQVFGSIVSVRITGRDRYRRYLGKVFYSKGRNLERELLRAGLAWHYKYYNKDKTLADLETVARAKRLGLWADPQPIPPWVYRRY